MPEEHEVREMVGRADELEDAGQLGAWPAQSYAEGVRAALMWALGEWDTEPLEREDVDSVLGR